jgi:hypothetical protein
MTIGASFMNPLVITNKTQQIFEWLNEVDLRMYNEISDSGVKEHEFGRLDPARIESSKEDSQFL